MDQPRPERWPLAALALGFVAGLRSQAPLAVLAVATRRGAIDPRSGPAAVALRSDRVDDALVLSAAGEIVVDKLPFVPSRLDLGPLLGRIAFGAAAGAVAARTAEAPAGIGAALGAAAAPLGAVAGHRYRTEATRLSGLPDLPWAVLEDAAALALAWYAVHLLAHPAARD